MTTVTKIEIGLHEVRNLFEVAIHEVEEVFFYTIFAANEVEAVEIAKQAHVQ